MPAYCHACMYCVVLHLGINTFVLGRHRVEIRAFSTFLLFDIPGFRIAFDLVLREAPKIHVTVQCDAMLLHNRMQPVCAIRCLGWWHSLPCNHLHAQ